MRTLIGIVTFGNLEFTKLAVRGIRETMTRDADLFIIVGKPNDFETDYWVCEQGILHIWHQENMGFPASINDIYDFAGWAGGRREPYDAIIIMGNDVVPYPGAIDALIEAAEDPKLAQWEWFCASQFDVKSLIARYPEARQFFHGEDCLFTDFNARPWEMHKDFREPFIEPDTLKDVHNLALFKRSVFEKIGYIDVNFFPAYFSDNDYAHRANLAGVKACGLPHSAYFHFWSRTIHQGSGGSTPQNFASNAAYYGKKWGGPVNGETFAVPFNGVEPGTFLPLKLPVTLKIPSRIGEEQQVAFWRGD